MLRGLLRHSVDIFKPSSYDIGNEVVGWEKVGSVKASVSVKDSLETSGHDHVGVEIIEITLPYSKKLDLPTSDLIITMRGHEYLVIAPPKNVRYMDKELKILAQRNEQSKRIL